MQAVSGMFMNAGNVIVVIGALSGAHALPACDTFEAERGWVQVDKKAVGAGSTEKANARLEDAVRAKLDGDEQIKMAKLAIEADVTRNQITLSGAVPSETLRAKAVELAKSAHAGVIVADKMYVRSEASTNQRWNDS